MLDIKDFYEAFGLRNDKGNVRYDKTGRPKSLVQPVSSEAVFKGYWEMCRNAYTRAGYNNLDSAVLADARLEEFKIDFPVMYAFWNHYLKQR